MSVLLVLRRGHDHDDDNNDDERDSFCVVEKSSSWRMRTPAAGVGVGVGVLGSPKPVRGSPLYLPSSLPSSQQIRTVLVHQLRRVCICSFVMMLLCHLLAMSSSSSRTSTSTSSRSHSRWLVRPMMVEAFSNNHPTTNKSSSFQRQRQRRHCHHRPLAFHGVTRPSPASRRSPAEWGPPQPTWVTIRTILWQHRKSEELRAAIPTIPTTSTTTTSTRTTLTRTPQHIPKTQSIAQSFMNFVNYCVQQMTLITTKQRQRRSRKPRSTKSYETVNASDNEPSSSATTTDNNNDNDDTTTTNKRSSGGGWFATLSRWNEQRATLVELANYKSSIVIPSFAALTIGALLVSIIPHYEAKCIQLVATLHPNRMHVLQAIIGLLITSTCAAIFTGLRGSLFWMAGSRANYHIRVQLHTNLLYQETAFFDETETGYLLSRLNSDVNKIGQVISYHVNVVCRQLAQFLFGSIYLIRISPLLSAYTGLGILAVALCSAIYGRFNRDCAMIVQDTYANATSVAETSFRLSETIRLLNGRQSQGITYEQAQRAALQVEEIQAWGYGMHKMVSDTLQSVLHGSLLFLCWWYGRYTIGLPAERMTTFLFYTHFVLESSNEVGDQWAKIQGAVGASQSVFGLLRRIPTLQDYYETTNATTTATTVLPNDTLQAYKEYHDDDDELVAVHDDMDVASDKSSTTRTVTERPSIVHSIPKVNGFGSIEPATITAAAAVPVPTIAATTTTTSIDPSETISANVSASMPHTNNGAVTDRPSRLPPTSNGVVVVNGSGATTTTTTTVLPSTSSSTAAAILSLSNVTLQYQAMDRPALSDVTVDFFPGDRVAIVGRSGSGKSSLLRTLLRLYDPTTGCVSYRGTALTQLSRRQLSSVLTMVPQEPALFPLSLLDNVLYGIDKDDTDHDAYSPSYQDRARLALEKAGLDIAEIPLDARIGDGGRLLSGGQKQRVAIARALVRQDTAATGAETILILDEPTAALDSATEQQVIGTLRDLMDQQTDLCVIMVTHRLNIIQALGVNRVIVMDQGRIVESGRPADLLTNANGIYSRLAIEQGILSGDKSEQQQQQLEQQQQQQPQSSTWGAAISTSATN